MYDLFNLYASGKGELKIRSIQKLGNDALQVRYNNKKMPRERRNVCDIIKSERRLLLVEFFKHSWRRSHTGI